MDAEDFPVDNSAKDEEIKDLTAGFPNRGITILLLTFFVEAVDLGYLAGLVITANEGHPVRVSTSMSELLYRKRFVSTDLAFRHNNSVNVSRLKYPRSTKSPKNM